MLENNEDYIRNASEDIDDDTLNCSVRALDEALKHESPAREEVFVWTILQQQSSGEFARAA